MAKFRLKLTFTDGSVVTVDFKPLFKGSPGLAPLRNAKAFAGATLADGEGWVVEWPALYIQIGADTLWLDAQVQNSPDENSRIFAQWRARYGLTLNQAAEALGMTIRTMSAYGTDARPVPRYIALACKGWEAEHGRALQVAAGSALVGQQFGLDVWGDLDKQTISVGNPDDGVIFDTIWPKE